MSRGVGGGSFTHDPAQGPKLTLCSKESESGLNKMASGSSRNAETSPQFCILLLQWMGDSTESGMWVHMPSHLYFFLLLPKVHPDKGPVNHFHSLSAEPWHMFSVQIKLLLRHMRKNSTRKLFDVNDARIYTISAQPRIEFFFLYCAPFPEYFPKEGGASSSSAPHPPNKWQMSMCQLQVTVHREQCPTLSHACSSHHQLLNTKQKSLTTTVQSILNSDQVTELRGK